MNRKIMIKTLELLEEAYPSHNKAKELLKKLKIKKIEGEFEKIIRYLKATNKIIVHMPESKIHPTARDKLLEDDEITINPNGIDFMDKIKRSEIEKERNYLLLDTTITLTLVAVLGIALTILEKFNLNISNSEINIPLLLSAIIWIVLITFILLLFYKIINIIFSKESWKGILFPRHQ